MIVRLQNLSARAPGMTDVQSVTHLLRLRDATDVYQSAVTEENIVSVWQTQNFILRKDAWVIVTNKGQIVAYADVRQDENERFSSFLHVHPDYRRRGIGTLLIWLVEERARQLVLEICSNARVGLRLTATSVNVGAQHLLEREGYTRVQSFWVTRQYDVYEKELLSRSPSIEEVCEDVCCTA